MQDLRGMGGASLLAAIFSQANIAPGWVKYDIANPTTRQVQTKMSFVQLRDDLAVGYGVCKNLATS